MAYEIQQKIDGEWSTFAITDQFCIAWDICEWQQDKHKKYPNVKFRILDVASQQIKYV